MGGFARSQGCFGPVDYLGLLLGLLSLLIGLLFMGTGSSAADVKFGEAEIKRAGELLARGDCNTAWNIAWPLAKGGNQEARNFLYASINGRMLPPGVTKDHISYYRHVLVLAAYAALSLPGQVPRGMSPGRRFARIDVPAAINGLKLGSDGERVAECYRRDPSFKSCLDLGVSLGVIPTFSAYAKETERRQTETGVAADCLPPN